MGRLVSTESSSKSVHVEGDGAASHFKQRYTLGDLTQFQFDFGLVRCGWTFACAGHGKSGCDGLGASIKHRLRRFLIGHDSNLLQTPRDVFELLQQLWASDKMPDRSDLSIRYPVYLDASEILRPNEEDPTRSLSSIRGLGGQGVRTIIRL